MGDSSKKGKVGSVGASVKKEEPGSVSPKKEKGSGGTPTKKEGTGGTSPKNEKVPGSKTEESGHASQNKKGTGEVAGGASPQKVEGVEDSYHNRVTLFMNYSPCSNCSAKLSTIASLNGSWKFIIRFLKCYMVNKWYHTRQVDLNEKGLRDLNKCDNVDIDILTHREYCDLFGNNEDEYLDKIEKDRLIEILHGLVVK